MSSAFGERSRKSEGIPIPPGALPGEAANTPPPDNVIEHWFDPKPDFRQRPFGEGGPMNDLPNAPISRAFPEQIIGGQPEPLGNVSTIAPADSPEAGGFRARPEFPEWNPPEGLPENIPGMRGGATPEAAGIVAALPAIVGTVQQQYQNTYAPPPASWESGVAGAEGSDPMQDPGTQGAEASPPDNSVSAGAFTDYGGTGLPGDSSGGWFDLGQPGNPFGFGQGIGSATDESAQ